MTPTPVLEDQLRATLQRQAGQAAPRADAADVRRRVQRRRRRAVPALGAAAAIVAGVTVTMRQHDGAGTSTAAQLVDERAPFAPRPGGAPYVALQGWDVTYYAEIRQHLPDGTMLADAEYQWSRDGQSLQLHLYAGGADVFSMRVSGDARSDAVLFGLPASVLDYGNGRYRVDVLVGDYTFEFDGEPFAGLEEFLTTIGVTTPTDSAPPTAVTSPPLDVAIESIGAPANATIPPATAAAAVTTAETSEGK